MVCKTCETMEKEIVYLRSLVDRMLSAKPEPSTASSYYVSPDGGIEHYDGVNEDSINENGETDL